MKPKEPSPRGALEWRRGKARLRLSLGSFGRRMLTLTTCRTEAAAEERRALLCPLAERLVASGQIALGFPLLEAAAVRDGRALEDVVKAIERVAKGEARSKASGEVTFRELGKRWTSGELAKVYPDQVRVKRSGPKDADIFEHYVYPYVGEVPIAAFTLDHGMAVMSRVPAERAPATRRQIAQAMRRLLTLAAFPLRLRADNPLPKGFLPRVTSRKAKTYVYPTEDRALLACAPIPLGYRVLYGFLAREGMRASEAARLVWSDLDLENGTVTLAENKTDDPRSWPLRPDVVRALRAWRALRRSGGDHRPAVFLAHPQPKHLRAHLQTAGVERAALFEVGAARQPIRVHDLRATFVTLALANGQTEDWVMRRTGHRSSTMVQLYRRGAMNATDLGLGDLAPMDAAIPELATGTDEAPGDTAPPRYGVGTAPCEASPGVSSASENPLKRSDSRHVKSTDSNFESSNHGSNPCVGTNNATAENHRGKGAAAARLKEGAPLPPYQSGTSAPLPARVAAVVRLAGELAGFAAAGDLEGARAVHETIGRLLAPVPRAGEGAAGGAVVLDLEAERERRAGR